jgi:uncharacterized protein (DUF302 family)
MELGISRTFKGRPFDDVKFRTIESLQENDFGVLTEVDIQTALKGKLDVDFRKYHILGACNPHLAHTALQQNLDIGILLPCNVIIYENDNGDITVTIMNVSELMGQILPDAKDLAREAELKLRRALDFI